MNGQGDIGLGIGDGDERRSIPSYSLAFVHRDRALVPGVGFGARAAQEDDRLWCG